MPRKSTQKVNKLVCHIQLEGEVTEPTVVTYPNVSSQPTTQLRVASVTVD
jgi:hypothetical protein